MPPVATGDSSQPTNTKDTKKDTKKKQVEEQLLKVLEAPASSQDPHMAKIAAAEARKAEADAFEAAHGGQPPRAITVQPALRA